MTNQNEFRNKLENLQTVIVGAKEELSRSDLIKFAGIMISRGNSIKKRS